MKINTLFVTFSFLTLLLVQSGQAAVREWQIDPAHTGFYFTVDHIFSKVRGHFGEFSGTVLFDPDNLAESSMRFVITVNSVDTAIPKRDKHLTSEDFFDAARYPQMTFESVGITHSGQNVYAVAGKLTVKGKSYDLILPLTLTGVKEHPIEKDKLVAGFNGTIVLDRLTYGIGSGKFYELGVVGKDVEVLVTMEALAKK